MSGQLPYHHYTKRAASAALRAIEGGQSSLVGVASWPHLQPTRNL